MSEDATINVEQADVLVEAQKRPISLDIPLPDHPMRRHWLFQFFDRSWRLAIYWFSALGTAYIMFLGHYIGKPMDAAYAAMLLVFIAGLIGNKTFEKLKGVS